MSNCLDVIGFVLLFLCECQGNLKSWLPCFAMCRVRMLVAADALAPEISHASSQDCANSTPFDKDILRGHTIAYERSVISCTFLLPSLF